MTQAQHVVLARRPNGAMQADDFQVIESTLPDLKEGDFLIENHILSLDAGFRQWMNSGASDNYLTEMPLNEPVQSIVLGQVIASRHPDYPEGVFVVGRTAWETHSISDGSDLMTIIDTESGFPLEQYLSGLGPSGMTAYFGLTRVGHPKPGDTILVSAAAGGVGSLVGQMAKILGCRTIGISSSEEKCAWLKQELAYDQTINYRQAPSLSEQLNKLAPEGIDIYFDNVGGDMLDTALKHLAQNSRVVLCGAISQYDNPNQPTGIHNLWELITKRARAEGFMFSDYIDEYSKASETISEWIQQGQLHTPLNLSTGIERTAQAFCDMLYGNNLGKSLIQLR